MTLKDFVGSLSIEGNTFSSSYYKYDDILASKGDSIVQALADNDIKRTEATILPADQYLDSSVGVRVLGTVFWISEVRGSEHLVPSTGTVFRFVRACELRMARARDRFPVNENNKSDDGTRFRRVVVASGSL